MDHHIDPRLLQKQVRFHLIGVGGNGAQLASRLARLEVAILALGHPYGVHVTAFDPGCVRTANIGRQAFSKSDIGLSKAVVTVNRLNAFFGLTWDAYPWSIQHEWKGHKTPYLPDVVVSCVDTRAARRDLHRYLIANKFDGYWLDLGNDGNSGQVVLGQPGVDWHRPGPNKYRLPTVADLYPELLDESIPDDNAPSCSVAVSLASQGLFVNDLITTLAAQLLYQLFDGGKLPHHGAVFNLDLLLAGSIDVDPATWARYGIELPPDPVTPAGSEHPEPREAAEAVAA